MLTVTGYNQTMQLLQNELKCLRIETENLLIEKASGRTLAQDIWAKEDIPPYDRSVMDGFAVLAADTFGAGASLPVMLEIAGEVGMGEYVTQALQKGRAFRIPTGGMLPPGSDGVVMVEYTEELDANTVLIEKSISPGENIIRKGEDIRAGERLFLKGHVLRPQDIGALAALGICTVAVYKQIRIGIISTGNEIVNLADKMKPGKIRDINTYALAAAIEKDGFLPETYGIVSDEFVELKNMLVLALQENDAVLISGGSSVGVMDMTLSVIDSIDNSKILIQGIALKPGKPTIAARVNLKPVFGLPGHPVSAFIVYHTVIAPVMRNLGLIEKEPIVKNAFFSENYATQPGRDEFIMVKLTEKEGKTFAEPVYAKSGMFLTITTADGLVRVPANKEGLYQNEQVTVELF